MIVHATGDMFRSNADAFVNPVNCIGTCGKGLAKEFAWRYPSATRAYREQCWVEAIRVGEVFVAANIVFFPTKTHWRFPSKLEYIQRGLDQLRAAIELHQWASIAVPALGCGNGGLDWKVVRALIEQKLESVSSSVMLFPPI